MSLFSNAVITLRALGECTGTVQVYTPVFDTKAFVYLSGFVCA